MARENTTLSRPAVRVALGGGGAKGIVHLGVLEAIEEHGLDITSVIGTSIGAIWAALFANALVAGRGTPNAQAVAIDTVTRIAYQLRFAEYRDFYVKALFAKGFVKGAKFEDWLGTQLWNRGASRLTTFRELAFDLTITATDALTGESLILNSKNTPDLPIARAVRASMSIQGFFKEVTIDFPASHGRMRSVRCWDGGTTGNCRFDIAYRQHPDRPVIASSVTYRGEPTVVDKGILRAPCRLSRIRDHTISILMSQIECMLLENLHESDRILVIRPPLEGIRTFDLDLPNPRKAEVIAHAHAHAAARIAEFRKQLEF